MFPFWDFLWEYWTCFCGTYLYQLYIPSKHKDCFRLCDWLSLRCLVSLIIHLPPICWSTFRQIYFTLVRLYICYSRYIFIIMHIDRRLHLHRLFLSYPYFSSSINNSYNFTYYDINSLKGTTKIVLIFKDGYFVYPRLKSLEFLTRWWFLYRILTWSNLISLTSWMIWSEEMYWNISSTKCQPFCSCFDALQPSYFETQLVSQWQWRDLFQLATLTIPKFSSCRASSVPWKCSNIF